MSDSDLLLDKEDYYKILTEKEGDKIEYLYESGYSIDEISIKLSFSETVITSLLKYRGCIDAK